VLGARGGPQRAARAHGDAALTARACTPYTDCARERRLCETLRELSVSLCSGCSRTPQHASATLAPHSSAFLLVAVALAVGRGRLLVRGERLVSEIHLLVVAALAALLGRGVGEVPVAAARALTDEEKAACPAQYSSAAGYAPCAPRPSRPYRPCQHDLSQQGGAASAVVKHKLGQERETQGGLPQRSQCREVRAREVRKGVARKNHIRHVRFFRRTFSSGVTLTHPFIHLTPF
jgi:hypothetical protein